jgi:hypothetical protein
VQGSRFAILEDEGVSLEESPSDLGDSPGVGQRRGKNRKRNRDRARARARAKKGDNPPVRLNEELREQLAQTIRWSWLFLLSVVARFFGIDGFGMDGYGF